MCGARVGQGETRRSVRARAHVCIHSSAALLLSFHNSHHHHRVPYHHTVAKDENTYATLALGLPRGSLRVTHRLDSSTSGVVLLGRTPEAVTAFNASVARKPGAKTMKKRYVMLVSSSASSSSAATASATTATTAPLPPVPLGSVVHWMYPGPFGSDALGGRGLKRSQAGRV